MQYFMVLWLVLGALPAFSGNDDELAKIQKDFFSKLQMTRGLAAIALKNQKPEVWDLATPEAATQEPILYTNRMPDFQALDLHLPDDQLRWIHLVFDSQVIPYEELIRFLPFFENGSESDRSKVISLVGKLYLQSMKLVTKAHKSKNLNTIAARRSFDILIANYFDLFGSLSAGKSDQIARVAAINDYYERIQRSLGFSKEQFYGLGQITSVSDALAEELGVVSAFLDLTSALLKKYAAESLVTRRHFFLYWPAKETYTADAYRAFKATIPNANMRIVDEQLALLKRTIPNFVKRLDVETRTKLAQLNLSKSNSSSAGLVGGFPSGRLYQRTPEQLKSSGDVDIDIFYSSGAVELAHEFLIEPIFQRKKLAAPVMTQTKLSTFAAVDRVKYYEARRTAASASVLPTYLFSPLQLNISRDGLEMLVLPTRAADIGKDIIRVDLANLPCSTQW